MEKRIARDAARGMVIAIAFCCATAAQASVFIYTATLSGANESPANASPGTGTASVTVDTDANTMRVQETFSGLLGTTTASHIHAATATPFTGTAIVATTTPTFAGFPLGVTSGTYDSGLLDLTSATSYNPAFILANGNSTTSAEAALLAALSNGEAYLNIHTTVVPGGEIRGFLAAAVPEPASWALMLLGFGGMGIAMRCTRRRKDATPAQVA